MDIGCYLPRIELVGKETGASEQQPESAPDLGIELIYILEILQKILPERLPDVKGVLAGTKAVLKDMMARNEGTILNISSIAGRKTLTSTRFTAEPSMRYMRLPKACGGRWPAATYA